MTVLFALLPACSAGLDATGQRCGGNISNAPSCPLGYTCVATQYGGPPVGDVGSVCQKNDLVTDLSTVGGGAGGAGAGGAAGTPTGTFGYRGLGGHPAEVACPAGLAYGNTLCGAYPDNTLCIMGCIATDGNATYAPPTWACYADTLAAGNLVMLAGHAAICVPVSALKCNNCPGFGSSP